MALTPTQQSNKEYIETLTQARIDELMPDGIDGPYSFIDQELEYASEFILTKLRRELVYSTAKNGSSETIEGMDDAYDHGARILLPPDYLRFIRLKLSGWKRSIDSIIDVDTREYKRQLTEMTAGRPQRPVAALVPYLGSTTVNTIGDADIQLDLNAILPDRSNKYRSVTAKVSYTHPKTSVKRQVSGTLGYMKDFTDNDSLSTAIIDLIAENSANFPDFAVTEDNLGKLTFSPNEPKSDMLGTKITVEITTGPSVGWSVVEVTALPSAGTYYISDLEEIYITTSYTIAGTETVAEHLTLIGESWKSSNTDRSYHLLKSDSYNAKIVLITDLTSSNYNSNPIIYTHNLKYLEGSNTGNYVLVGDEPDQFAVADNTVDDLGYLPSSFSALSTVSNTATIKYAFEEHSRQALECFPKGNVAIEEFIYIPKTDYWDLPRSLWDPLTWYGASRILSILQQKGPADMAFQNMLQLVGGRLIGFRQEKMRQEG